MRESTGNALSRMISAKGGDPKQCALIAGAGILLGISVTVLVSRATSDAADPVVAKWSGGKAKASEAYANIRGHLSNLMDEEFRTKTKAIQDYVDGKLLEEQAKKEKLPVAALVARESTGPVAKPTDAEIETFLAGRGLKMNDPRIKKEDVRQYMTYLKHTDKKDAYVAKLRETAKTKVLLHQPNPPRLEVATEHYPTWGNPGAPVTIVEFSDYSSPEGSRAAPMLSRIRREYGPDKVKVVYRDMPVAARPRSVDAAMAAHCADEQGKFWDYHDALFANVGKFSDADLKAHASDLKLDTEQFGKCLSSKKFAGKVDKSRSDGETTGIRMVPSFVVNGIVLEGAVTYERLKEKIDRELGQMS